MSSSARFAADSASAASPSGDVELRDLRRRASRAQSFARDPDPSPGSRRHLRDPRRAQKSRDGAQGLGVIGSDLQDPPVDRDCPLGGLEDVLLERRPLRAGRRISASLPPGRPGGRRASEDRLANRHPGGADPGPGAPASSSSSSSTRAAVGANGVIELTFARLNLGDLRAKGAFLGLSSPMKASIRAPRRTRPAPPLPAPRTQTG